MDLTPTPDERHMQSLIDSLAEICNAVRQFGKPSPFPSATAEKRIIFGQLIGFVAAHPEATARYLWRLNEGR